MNYLIFSITIFSLYLGYVIDRYGVQKSISMTYYLLPVKQKYLFTLALWGFAIPVMIVGNTPLLFFAGALIGVVATAPMFQGSKMEFYMHMSGAYGGIILAYLSLIIDFQMYYFAAGVLALCIVLYKYAINYIFYIEVAAFLSIWGALFINQLK